MAIKVEFSAKDVLLGEIRKDEKILIMNMLSFPKKEFLSDIYVLASRDTTGKLKTIMWEFAKDEFCVDKRIARQLAVEDQLSKLYKSGQLTCSREIAPFGWPVSQRRY